jgi:hypothetical protein
MANRMRRGVDFKNVTGIFTHQKTIGPGSDPYRRNGPLAIWTTDVWEKEAMQLRCLEQKLVEVVQRWTNDIKGDETDTARFVREFVDLEPSRTGGIMAELFRRIRRVP